jgi:hypothetical protein
MNLGHERQAWYEMHREINEGMGVQVNPGMPKMWTPLRNSSARHYVHIPIGDRKNGKSRRKRHTHPGLTRFLLSMLLEFKRRKPRKAPMSMEHYLQELKDAQDDIGWDKLMFGHISVLWQ